MNIKKFFKKTFPSFTSFKTTPRTREVLELFCRNNSVEIFFIRLWIKDRYFNWFFRIGDCFDQDLESPRFNIKRKLTEDVYEAEVLFEGDVLPFVAVSDGGCVELIPDSEEAMKRMGVNPKHCIMLRFMSQIQQAKELSALNEAMNKGAQHDTI